MGKINKTDIVIVFDLQSGEWRLNRETTSSKLKQLIHVDRIREPYSDQERFNKGCMRFLMVGVMAESNKSFTGLHRRVGGSYYICRVLAKVCEAHLVR